ncbi:MAG: response regulator [Bacteroidales bacterium]|jgi:CheY-like chemotaxis protein
MKPKILIAEDNYINQKLMEKLCQFKEWECRLVEDGTEAVSTLRKEHFDVVLMDISMPDMDGYQATQLIREFNKEIPIIAITANAIEGFREKCINCGMNDYISKPFRKGELFAIIEKYLPEAN